MKKLITFILTLAVVASMSVTAFAAEINQDSSPKSNNTTVTHTVAPTYTVTIPANVELGPPYVIKAGNVVIPLGKTLTVKLTGTSGDDNSFTLKSAEGAELAYGVTAKGNDVSVNDTVLEVNPMFKDSDIVPIFFEANDEAKYAGDYSGTVTFTVSLEDSY